MFGRRWDRRRPDRVWIPRQRTADDDDEEARIRDLDAPYMDQQRVQLLRDAEQSRLRAGQRAKLVKQYWVRSEMATRDRKRVADAHIPEVVDAYGGSRAASDPLYKKFTAENTWFMTRSQAMAINFLCEQNKIIIELLRKIAGDPEGTAARTT
jgi:hypothetical protein